MGFSDIFKGKNKKPVTHVEPPENLGDQYPTPRRYYYPGAKDEFIENLTKMKNIHEGEALKHHALAELDRPDHMGVSPHDNYVLGTHHIVHANNIQKRINKLRK